MKALLLIGLLLIWGCSKELEISKNLTAREDINKTMNITEQNSSDIKEEPFNFEKERRYEARGFGIFDFNILNRENCDEKYELFKSKSAELSKDIREESEELEEEIDDLEKAENELENARESGDEHLINRALRDYEEENEDVEETEDELEDLENLKKRYEIISGEIDKICKRLKTGEQDE